MIASSNVAVGGTDTTPFRAEGRFPTVRPMSGWPSSSGLELIDSSLASPVGVMRLTEVSSATLRKFGSVARP